MSELTVRDGPPVVKAFLALLWRDAYVTGRNPFSFLAQVLVQPVFLLFVFGKVLSELGYTQGNYPHVLFPGIVALLAFSSAFQNTALPLVIDFSYTKEIEDRLLAPLPTNLVAVEKVIFSTLRALVAVAAVFPIGYWMLGSLPMSWGDVPVVVMFLTLGSLAGTAFGLALGTVVEASKVSFMFTIIWPPLIFTGSVQYPWMALGDMRWFQVLSAFNPITYVSEAMRGQMLDGTPHIPIAVCGFVLLAIIVVLTTIGMLGFRRRALD